MKVRIGFGLGTRTLTNDQDRFGTLVDDLERLRFDSLWLSERINAPAAPTNGPPAATYSVPSLDSARGK